MIFSLRIKLNFYNRKKKAVVNAVNHRTILQCFAAFSQEPLTDGQKFRTLSASSTREKASGPTEALRLVVTITMIVIHYRVGSIRRKL